MLISRPSDSYSENDVSIRMAGEADTMALEILAALDSALMPPGEVLIAEVNGEPLAAIEISSGAAIADPFRPTTHLVDRLRIRAARLREAADSPRWMRPRVAAILGG